MITILSKVNETSSLHTDTKLKKEKKKVFSLVMRTSRIYYLNFQM